MTNKRPYWQVAVSLLFSIVATVGFVLIGWKLLGFLMPFVVGWIIASIATPVVNWLEKRLKIRKKLGSALIIIGVLALMGTLGYFAVSWLVSEVSSLIKDFPEMYVQLEKGLHQIGILCPEFLANCRMESRMDGRQLLRIWMTRWEI